MWGVLPCRPALRGGRPDPGPRPLPRQLYRLRGAARGKRGARLGWPGWVRCSGAISKSGISGSAAALALRNVDTPLLEACALRAALTFALDMTSIARFANKICQGQRRRCREREAELDADRA